MGGAVQSGPAVADAEGRLIRQNKTAQLLDCIPSANKSAAAAAPARPPVFGAPSQTTSSTSRTVMMPHRLISGANQ
jgi:hypothetical protein